MKTNILRLMHLFILVAFSSTGFLQAQNCIAVDKPDIYFMDSNKDGIDGDTSKAIFVSSTSGNDNQSGNIKNPVATLQKAMDLAALSNKDIYVAQGTYTLTQPLQVANGVSMYGLFDDQNAWSRKANNKTTINGPQNVLLIKGNTSSSTIAGFEIIAADAVSPGSSSQTIIVSFCSELMIFIGNTIKSGKGANGSNGSDGVQGADGGNGGNGGNGVCDGSSAGIEGAAGISSCGRNGGKGGKGGVKAQNGIIGQNGAGATQGGSGGLYGSVGGPGVKGTNGSNGVAGAAGSAASNAINFASDNYTPNNGADGSNGTDGNGGGGGGGGGGQSCSLCIDGSGNGGGGGGAGGCMGLAGLGGMGGGASIAVLVIHSTVYLENNVMITKSGGNGGAGGNGGIAGLGGSPGKGGVFCTLEIGAGADGGKGGDGGAGGGGAGGNGGPSVGIVSYSGQVNEILNTFTIGLGGTGGNGGLSPGASSAANGLQGANKSIEGPSNSFEPSVSGEFCIEDLMLVKPASGTLSGKVHIYLSKPSPKSVSVDYTYTNGTAIEGVDFNFNNGNASFPAYTTAGDISFDIIATPTDSSDKTFTITLSNVLGDASIQRSKATVTIKGHRNSSIQSVGNTDIPFIFREYPNPFSDMTDIFFSVPTASEISMLLYDANGKLVKTIFQGIVTEGENTVSLSSDYLSPGVYYCACTLNQSAIVIRKLVLIK